MISKRRIMIGLKARTRERSRRQVGIRLRSASRVSENSYGRVRRSLDRTLITRRILNGQGGARRALFLEISFCSIDAQVTGASRSPLGKLCGDLLRAFALIAFWMPSSAPIAWSRRLLIAV
jgi:hypothetical protein